MCFCLFIDVYFFRRGCTPAFSKENPYFWNDKRQGCTPTFFSVVTLEASQRYILLGCKFWFLSSKNIINMMPQRISKDTPGQASSEGSPLTRPKQAPNEGSYEEKSLKMFWCFPPRKRTIISRLQIQNFPPTWRSKLSFCSEEVYDKHSVFGPMLWSNDFRSLQNDGPHGWTTKCMNVLFRFP